MATIKCPKCGAQISDKAVACKNCAYPWKRFSQIHYANFKFNDVSRTDISSDCYLFDKDFRRLANCKIGEETSFVCCEPIEVFVQMAGCMCKPSITVSVGKRYIIRLIRFGLVSVEEI